MRVAQVRDFEQTRRLIVLDSKIIVPTANLEAPGRLPFGIMTVNFVCECIGKQVTEPSFGLYLFEVIPRTAVVELIARFFEESSRARRPLAGSRRQAAPGLLRRRRARHANDDEKVRRGMDDARFSARKVRFARGLRTPRYARRGGASDGVARAPRVAARGAAAAFTARSV